jgi:hypothetical protein
MMKLFLKTLFSLFAILGVTVGEVKSSTITDLGANRLSEVTVSAQMTDHQRIMSNPVVQGIHRAQGEFWDSPATQVVLDLLPVGGVAWADRDAKALFSWSKAAKVAKTGGNLVEQVAVHGNSLKSMRPTWGYKLYDNSGNFLKNGITSQPIPEMRYTQKFMRTHYMDRFGPFPNRLKAYQWEYQQNLINRGQLNLNMH